MRKLITAAALAAFTFTTVAAAPMASDPPEGYDYLVELKKGDTAAIEVGSGGGGVSTNGLIANATLGFAGGFDPNACSSGDNAEKCDKVFLDVKSGSLDALFTPAYGGDFDVYLYEADADGVIGEEVTHSAKGWNPVMNDPIDFTGPTEAFTVDVAKGNYALVVFYFAAGGGYTLDLGLS